MDARLISGSEAMVMPCPDDDTYARMVQGMLPPERVAELERHLDRCAACTDLVAQLGKVYGPTIPPPVAVRDAARPTRGTLVQLEAGMALAHLLWAGLVLPIGWRVWVAASTGAVVGPVGAWSGADVFAWYVVVWAPVGAVLAAVSVLGLLGGRRWGGVLAGLHAVLSLASLVLLPLGVLVLREVLREGPGPA